MPKDTNEDIIKKNDDISITSAKDAKVGKALIEKGKGDKQDAQIVSPSCPGKETDNGGDAGDDRTVDIDASPVKNKSNGCNCDISWILPSIQRTIDRMSGNSAIFKTIFATFVVMSVTIFIGFVSSDNCKVCPIATPIYAGFICFLIVSFLVFSLFDAYYLSLERGYVNLYNKIRKTKDVSDFKYVPITVRTIDTEDKNEFFQQKDYDRTRIWKCWISPTVIWFYFLFLLGAVAIVTICFLYSIKSGKAVTCDSETQGLKSYINLLTTTLFSLL